MLFRSRTFVRQADWRDQRTFIDRTIADGGDSPRMHMNHANVEAAAGRTEIALTEYREALQRAPDQSIIWLGYANLLLHSLHSRDFSAAREALTQAEKSSVLGAECRQTRAVLDLLEHQRDPGDLLREALALAPKNWSIRKQYLEDLGARGQQERAIRELSAFLETADFRGDSWKLMGRLLESIHRSADALTAYREAAARDVHDDETRARIVALSPAP